MHAGRVVFVALVLLLPGCGSQSSAPGGAVSRGGRSDPEQVRTADVSVLFVGNSHTSYHDLPHLVCEMIRFRHPDKKVYSHVLSVSFLEDVAHDPGCREEVETRPWKHVVLQAQKISMSGRFDYSRVEGIDYAKSARARGAVVLFFSEWGQKDVDGEGRRTEKIYREMAGAADASVAPIGRAWDLALTRRPDLPLHSSDGNHQSRHGAFLTACVLFGRLTGESPAAVASFPYPEWGEEDRKFLAEAAATAIARDAGGADYP